MTLLDYLKKKYGANEPIFFNEISFNNYSKIWIKKELNKLVKSNNIKRFDRGIYYIPTLTEIGVSTLDPYDVILKKYVSNEDKSYGYFSGAWFKNRLGLSTQVPRTIEIYTNKETNKKRNVNIGAFKVILRKARVNITKENEYVLSLLELMNDINIEEMNKTQMDLIKDYIKMYNIKREDVVPYISSYPSKAIKTLVQSGLLI